MTVGIFVLAIILLIYSPWFTLSGTFSSGDWPYLFKENIAEFSFFSKDWILWLTPYYQTTAKIFVDYLNFPWEVAERIFWFWPFVLVSIIASFTLFRNWISVLIYTTNTYILMIVSGGQMGVAMAYACSPLVLHVFIKLISQSYKTKNFYMVITTGMVFGVGTMFDPRLTYIILLAVILYFILHLLLAKKTSIIDVSKQIISIILFPTLIGYSINFYWIKHIFTGNVPKILQEHSSVIGFKFLSISDFSHTFSLLHPNWPENIFGKTYFLQPEFLVLPILAYLSLLFVQSLSTAEDKETVIFYGFIGLLGVFLAKGSNPPFGFINEWLFEHVPGMNMFRDATKFYLLIALSYSFLIPFALNQIPHKVKHIKTLTAILLLIIWSILIRQALMGQLKGTFQTYTVPIEYLTLKDFLQSTQGDFKTLWIPEKQRYGFYSDSHPAVSARELLGIQDPIAQAKELRFGKKNLWKVALVEMNIGFIVIPYDSQSELFIDDRKYSKHVRDLVERDLDSTPWLKNKKRFGGITVYEVSR